MIVLAFIFAAICISSVIAIICAESSRRKGNKEYYDYF